MQGNNNTYRLTNQSYLTVIFLLLSCLVAYGQNQVAATIDTNQIRIGEQFNLKLIAGTAKGNRVLFPSIPDTLKGLEVVSRTSIDTAVSEDGKQLTLSQQLTITAFDSGFYVVEPFTFLITSNGKTDSLSTEAQLITVKTIPVDTTKAIKAIKPVMEPPFDWRELLPWLYLLLALSIVGGGLYYYIQKRRNRPVVPLIPKVPERPAHEIALEALEQLEREKLWQQGAFKEYHIRLSDTVRTYIENRFRVAALESTTDETLTGLRRHSIESQLLRQLESIFRLADMVKFAKAIPIVTENEQSMADARTFIISTAEAIAKKEDTQ